MAEPSKLMPYSSAGSLNEFAALQQICLIVALYQDEKAIAESILGSGPGREVKLWAWQPLRIDPSIAVLRDNDDWWIVVAGTTNKAQYVGHVGGIYGLDYPLQEGVLVHAMYYLIFLNGVREMLDPILPLIPGSQRFHLCGHSYGGAIAHLYGNYLVSIGHKEKNVEVLTFGGVKSLSGGYEGPAPRHYFRVCQENDPFPWLPPTSMALLLAPKSGRRLFKMHRQKWSQYGDRYELTDDGKLTPTDNRESAYLDKPFPVPGSWLASHASANYLRQMELRIFNVFKGDPRGPFLVNTAETLLALPDKQNDGPEPPPASYTSADAINFMWTGKLPPKRKEPDPVDDSNLAQVAVAVAAASGTTEPRRNIAPLGGFGGFVPSNIWRITVDLNDGDNGRSHTMCIKKEGSTALEDAIAAGKLLASKFADLLGNFSATRAANVKSRGRPVAEFLHVHDAKEAREGVTIPLDLGSYLYYGPAGDVENYADSFAVGLSLKMRGLCATAPTRKGTASLTFSGQPDGVVKKARYMGKDYIVQFYAGRPSWDKLCRDFLTFLVANGWGFMGRSPAEADKRITGFDLDTDGFLKLTVTGHGYSDQDVVQLKGCNKPGFKQHDRITVIDANTIVLLDTRPGTGITLPTAGKIYRTRTAAGVPLTDFYAFQTYPGGWPDPLPLTVRAHRPGRQFVPVGFSRPGSKRTL